MEQMAISVVSVIERQGIVIAGAPVEADRARIWVEVQFKPEAGCCEIWREARDQVLRYLDPA